MPAAQRHGAREPRRCREIDGSLQHAHEPIVLRRQSYLPNIYISTRSITTYPIKETTSFPQNPTPFNKLDLALLKSLITLIQRRNPLLEPFTPLNQLVDIRSHRCSQGVREFIRRSHRNRRLFHLSMEVSCSFPSTSAPTRLQPPKPSITRTARRKENVNPYSVASRHYPTSESHS